jgi:hypothetical protein
VLPKVKPGEHPSDDAVFPVIWQKGREPAMA